MTKDEAGKVLFDALVFVVPTFEKGTIARHKAEALEDWSLDACGYRARLEEARWWMNENLHIFTKEWAKLVGWEVDLPGSKKRRDATKEDITEAKRMANPALWENISDLKHLVSGLTAQIRRIEGDEARVSRVYTFITGT